LLVNELGRERILSERERLRCHEQHVVEILWATDRKSLGVVNARASVDDREIVEMSVTVACPPPDLVVVVLWEHFIYRL